MSSTTVDDLNTWIAKMMSSLEIKDYKLDVGGNTIKGDGYLGEVTFLKVHTNKNGTKKDYDLVIKSAKQSKELRKQTPIKEAYDRETLFYSKIWPVLNEFQKEKQVRKPFTYVPKCYYISEEVTKEAVILENLKSLGFDLHDRKQPMNLNHVLMVVQNYGKYHALSIALRRQKPATFKSLTKNLPDLFGEFIQRMDMLGFFTNEFNELKKILKDAGETQVLEKFDGFEKEFEKLLINYTNEESDLSCLVHGDCWNNNFMFKYEGDNNTKPVDMCILDFQIVRVASPIMDLSYFLYSCGDKQIFENFDFILQAYYSSLTDFLVELGCKPEDAFSFKKLKENWKDHGRYGLVLALLLVKISLCDPTEAPDLMETAEKGENFNENFKIDLTDKDVYGERIKNVYKHFAEKFL